MSDALRVLDGVMRLADLVQRDAAESFAGTALTTSRAHLLWVVHHTGPSTQQSLAAALAVTPRNITGLVDALESAGYVERAPHPSDRRATLVTLTALGERTAREMSAQREQLASDLVAGLDEAEQRALAAGLDRLSERFEALVAAADAPSPEHT
ncbi:MarR family winged helix-turn-helix transcriptional regulator [Kineococcus terrestris]|uniref:MarR family winged helix-turn-helix transcriptional regulator n=1 Tax=Kineococcus terrestris TaxID=2044856 RepID=UPI0034DB3F54